MSWGSSLLASLVMGKSEPARPAPLYARGEPIDPVLQIALSKLHEAGITKSAEKNHAPISILDNMSRLAKADPDLLVEVTDHIVSSGEQEIRCWKRDLLAMNICEGTNDRQEYRQAYLKRLAIMPVIARIASKHPRYSLEAVSNSIINQTGDVSRSSRTDDLDYLKAAAAYIGLLMLADDEQNMVVRLTSKDHEVINFLSKRFDEFDLILDELADRRLVGQEVIEQFLNGPSALSSGNL